MNRGIYALPVITILGLLAGCVSGPPLQTTIIVSPSKPLEIYGVRTYRTNKGVLVMESSAADAFSRTRLGSSPC